MYGRIYIKSNKDQPGKVGNPVRGQLNREMYISLSALFAPENLVLRDGFGSPVPHQPSQLHTQAESGAYLRDSSRVPRRRPFIYLKPPYAIGYVPSFSVHAIAYRWRSLILFIFSERAVWGAGGGGAARLFLLFSFPCSADHERDWPPCKVVFSGWQPIR